MIETACARPQGEDTYQADKRTDGHVRSDGHGCAELLQQDHRNDWRRTASRDRRELITERRSAIAQRSREAFGDEGCLGSVLQIMKRQSNGSGDKDPDKHPGVEHREVDEREYD